MNSSGRMKGRQGCPPRVNHIEVTHQSQGLLNRAHLGPEPEGHLAQQFLQCQLQQLRKGGVDPREALPKDGVL